MAALDWQCISQLTRNIRNGYSSSNAALPQSEFP